tara:strand:- start:364 stop:1005 length:642 start_codon:yes stop_codon:yes gene_type:complete
MSNYSDYYLEQLGIERWVLRKPRADTKRKLSELLAESKACTKCEFHRYRTNTVFSKPHQSKNPVVMIVGAAPGYNEELREDPIVGKPLQLMNKMLQSIGLNGEDVYITNLLKCRPPENRSLNISDFETCSYYFEQQVNLIQPKVIWCLGELAGSFLAKTMVQQEALRVQQFAYQNIPLIISRHPNELLNQPIQKKRAYKDLQQIQLMLLKKSQ